MVVSICFEISIYHRHINFDAASPSSTNLVCIPKSQIEADSWFAIVLPRERIEEEKRAAEKEERETSCGREVHGRVRDLGYISIACGRHMHGVHGDQMSFGFLAQFEKF